jgi:hypothetical protein
MLPIYEAFYKNEALFSELRLLLQYTVSLLMGLDVDD